MDRLILFLGIGLLASASISASAAQTGDHESAWEKAAERHHTARQKLCGAGTDAGLREQIDALYKRDQQARKFMMTLPQASWTAEMGHAQQATDVETTAELKALVETRGWPTCSLVGADASDRALLIADHSPDHHWQKQLLSKLKPMAENNEIEVSQFAVFEDKVLIADGHKQRYGTQFKFANGKLMMYAVDDPSRLTARRSKAFLPPLAEYRRMLSEIYHLQETEEVVPPPVAQP